MNGDPPVLRLQLSFGEEPVDPLKELELEVWRPLEVEWSKDRKETMYVKARFGEESYALLITDLVRVWWRAADDEAVRRETTLERMASLQPAFVPDGVVTAGNSSQIVDASAAVLLASEAKASQLGLEPRARFLSFGIAGVDPHLMLHGNPDACERALAKAGLGWNDIEVIEVNEAFASVVAQFLADTRLGERYEAGDVNPNGGGISLGHPLGATGARITATLVSELERRDARYGIACMCIGFGQAIAGVVERL